MTDRCVPLSDNRWGFYVACNASGWADWLFMGWGDRCPDVETSHVCSHGSIVPSIYMNRGRCLPSAVWFVDSLNTCGLGPIGRRRLLAWYEAWYEAWPLARR